MKILQIIPANDARACYASPTGKKGVLRKAGDRELICWALVEQDDGNTEIIGMIAFRNKTIPAYDFTKYYESLTFLGYFYGHVIDMPENTSPFINKEGEE